MAQRARDLLSRERVADRILDVRAARDRLDGLRRDLSRAEARVSAWDKVVFFTTSNTQAEANALQTQVEEAEVAHATAFAAWKDALATCADLVPIALLVRIECVLMAVLDDPEVGRDESAGEVHAKELDAIADHIVEVWAPGADLVSIAARLPNDDLRRGVSPPGPLAEDPLLGWAPFTPDELFARVAYALENSGEFAAARAGLAREHSEDAGFSRALEHARAQVTFGDKLLPGRGVREREVARLEREITREEGETAYAVDRLRYAVVRAFSAHPLMWLHFALVGAAAAIRIGRPSREVVLDGDGEAELTTSASARASVLACLVEVRRACERAFPGVPSQIWPRGRQTVAPVAQADGPYRVGADVTDVPAAEELSDAEQAFFEKLEATPLRETLSTAVAVATLLGFVSRHLGRTEVAWLDRLAFWSDTADEMVRDSLQSRVDLHTGTLEMYGVRALEAVARLAVDHHPTVGLGHALARASQNASKIQTLGGSSSSPRTCPAINKHDTQSWLRHVDRSLSRFYAVGGDRGTWINDICRRLGSTRGAIAPPETIQHYEDVIELLAAHLVSTPFLALVNHGWELRRGKQQSQHAAAMAARRVSFWDKLNFFDDTEDEKLRDQQNAQAKQLGQTLVETERQISGLLERALQAYPPLGVYEDLLAAHAFVQAVQARSERRTRTHRTRNSKGRVISTRTTTYYVCVIRGVSAAQDRVEHLARRAQDVFGKLPVASDALEDWIAREL